MARRRRSVVTIDRALFMRRFLPIRCSLLCFASMPKEHFRARRPSSFAEVFGGPADYSKLHGGHAAMIRHHLGKGNHRTATATLGRPPTGDGRRTAAAGRSGISFRAGRVSGMGFRGWQSSIRLCRPRRRSLSYPCRSWNWGVPGGPYQPE